MSSHATRVLVLTALVALGAPAAAGPAFPEAIPLPDGFQPEGIATGRGPVVYAGSLADGAIYEADLRTGAGRVLVAGSQNGPAVGLAFDPRSGLLFVSGGPTGQARVYDTRTGALVATYQLTPPGTFVNDAVVTRDAVYFTDSFAPYVYVLPLGGAGRLPSPGGVSALELTGDFTFTGGGAFNANGIEATPDGRWLFVVRTVSGELFRVDPETGVAELIELGGVLLPAGDGLLLQGRTLYVVQNQLDQVSVVELASDWRSGTVVATITSPRFRVPTTIAGHGDRLYVVNARFDTPPTPDTDYDVVMVP